MGFRSLTLGSKVYVFISCLIAIMQVVDVFTGWEMTRQEPPRLLGPGHPGISRVHYSRSFWHSGFSGGK